MAQENLSYDLVNHPQHYTSGNVECIEAIKASMNHQEFCGYLKGNAMKYLWRYRLKQNPGQDLRKAMWYLQMLDNEVNDESGRNSNGDV